MTGPLYWTATGGTTARSAQDRSADVANVLDFGADPTGVLDSAPAFNRAIASRPFNNGEVYIPAGVYLLRDAVTLGASCVIRGAGRQLTLLKIDSTFNMSAQGVFVFGSDPGHAGTPAVKDLWVRFAQPNFAGMSRADLIQYPPAFYKAAATLTGRPNFENLMISSAWVGFDLDNCAAYADNIYMSALSYGFLWSKTTPTLDCVRLSNVHFWGFDFIPTSPLGVLFLDGTTNCAWFGRIDGLYLVNFFSESSIITVDCGPGPAGGYYFFQQIGLDGPANLVINSNVNLQIDSVSNSRGNTGRFTTPGIIINGGRNAIGNSYLASSHATLPVISVTAGSLQYFAGSVAWPEFDTPFMTCSGGTLEVRDVSFATHLATARTTPIIAQTGTGYVHVFGCRFANFPSASVPPVSVINSANAFIDANNYGGMSQVMPTDYQTVSFGNRSIRGDASVPTAAQLSLRGLVAANSVESKMRFYGSFGSGADFNQYLTASLRGGFVGAAGWNTSFLDVWLTTQNNSAASDSNMTQAARFTSGGLTVGAGASAINQAMILNSAAGTFRSFGIQTAGSLRWVLQATNTAEGGSNAGSDLILQSYTDGGAPLIQPLTVSRASGIVAINQLAINANSGPTIRAGTGAASGTQPKGSQWLRTDGAVGSTLYISQGAGTWNAVAGV